MTGICLQESEVELAVGPAASVRPVLDHGLQPQVRTRAGAQQHRVGWAWVVALGVAATVWCSELVTASYCKGTERAALSYHGCDCALRRSGAEKVIEARACGSRCGAPHGLGAGCGGRRGGRETTSAWQR